MNTMQADLSATLERFRADMAKREVQKTERDATARWWQTAIMLAGFGVVLGGIGVATSLIIN